MASVLGTARTDLDKLTFALTVPGTRVRDRRIPPPFPTEQPIREGHQQRGQTTAHNANPAKALPRQPRQRRTQRAAQIINSLSDKAHGPAFIGGGQHIGRRGGNRLRRKHAAAEHKEAEHNHRQARRHCQPNAHYRDDQPDNDQEPAWIAVRQLSGRRETITPAK